MQIIQFIYLCERKKDKMERSLLGIEIGGTKLQLFLSNLNGEIYRKYRYEVGSQKKASIILSLIQDTILKELNDSKIEAIGVGFGGPVNIKTGEIFNSYQVDGWSGFNIVQWLNNLIPVPVFVENDANLAAYAEAINGAGKDSCRVFYNTIGSGCGGGFVCNGSIYHGSRNGEFEFGHIKLRDGNISIESQCSGWAINKKIREAVGQFPNSKLADLIGDTTSCESKFLASAIEVKCSVADSIFIELVENLALGYSHVVHLVNPEKIVIGGGVSLMGEILRNSIEVALPKYLLDAFTPGPTICLAELGEDVVGVGAILFAKNQIK